MHASFRLCAAAHLPTAMVDWSLSSRELHTSKSFDLLELWESNQHRAAEMSELDFQLEELLLSERLFWGREGDAGLPLCRASSFDIWGDKHAAPQWNIDSVSNQICLRKENPHGRHPNSSITQFFIIHAGKDKATIYSVFHSVYFESSVWFIKIWTENWSNSNSTDCAKNIKTHEIAKEKCFSSSWVFTRAERT